MEANQALRARFSSAVSTTVEDAGIANKDINSSIDRQYLKLYICTISALTVLNINFNLQKFKYLQIHCNLIMKLVGI